LQTRNGVSWEKKDKVCTAEEKPSKGSQWDHVVLDVESRAVISLVCGKRTKENTEELIADFASRANDGKPPQLFTTDADWCYKGALLCVYGEWVAPEPTGKRGRPRQPYQVVPDMQYVTVKKTRKGGRVVNVTTEQVYGTPEGLRTALDFRWLPPASTRRSSNGSMARTGILTKEKLAKRWHFQKTVSFTFVRVGSG